MRLLNNNKNTLSIINALNESLTETQNNSDEKSFYDYVVEDFNTYLDHNNISPDNITEEDLGDYFIGFVHEIENDEDIDELNRAEDFIRSKYNIIDNTDDYQEYDDGDTDWAAEEESDALDRFENRYMSGGNGATLKESEDSERILAKLVKDLPDIVEYKGKMYQAFNVMSNDTTGATSKVYYCNMENTPNGDPQESNDYFFVVATLKKTDRGYKGVDHINYIEDLTEGVKHITESASDRYQVREFDGPGAKFGVYDTKQKKFVQKGSKKVMIASCNDLNKKASLKESVKSKKKAKKEKKPEERIIMKQGNVTCLKKDSKFKVFEDADTNLVEYDNQEEAMRDALNRCGVNPDNELHEEKDDLKESTQYQVIKTLNVGPSNYQSEVHGTYNSYEQAEDICNELNAQGIGATIKEVNEIDEALKKLLLKKEELYNDDTISDEDYYSQIEIIDNIIANNYSVKDIEEAEKELGINS